MESGSRHLPDPAQRVRMDRFSADACVDIHCHCLAGVDDGPETVQQSLELCRALVADGITHVIATPHQLGSFTGTNQRTMVLESVAALREQLDLLGVPLNVEPGADVRIDERIPAMLDGGEILTLADGNAYILLELPHDTLIDPLFLIKQLSDRGIRCIISHPERQAMIARRPELVAPWLQAGAILQVTSASLIGEFGPPAFTAAWRLLEAGAVSLIASDAHNTGQRPPRMTQAIRAISERLGHAVARRLCLENPCKVLLREQIHSPRFSRTAR